MSLGLPDKARHLPRIRNDLAIEKAGPFDDGAPSWLIHDRLSNRFYRVGEQTVELLSIWKQSTLEQFIKFASLKLGRMVERQEVTELAELLHANSLTVDGPGGNSATFYQQEMATKKPVHETLFHTYLFFRIPLVNPQSFLDSSWLWVRWFFTAGFIRLLLCLTPIALFLISRQWDAFQNTFVSMISMKGLVLYGMCLVLLKSLHELGHAFMAKKYGIEVPTIGVAFLLLFPVLYTDTSAAARLPDKRHRLLIDTGGIIVELAIAVLASLLWVFLPDGTLRAIAFTTATLSWVVSLTVNLNPFMRFDGYYILSDFIGVENLQERSFALAKWKLRETLFGLKHEPPEVLEQSKARTLILYAYLTWIYRFFLFLGIALLVYHFFFKALGVLLFVMELIWFIARPIWRELQTWIAHRKAASVRRSMITLSLVALAIVILAVPWSTRIEVPAVMRAEIENRLYAGVEGQVLVSNLAPLKQVTQGEVLLELSSPSLKSDLEIALLEEELLKTRIRRAAADRIELATINVLEQQLQSLSSKVLALQLKQDELIIRAPIDGLLENVDTPLSIGQWIGKGEFLGIVRSLEGSVITGLVKERDLERLTKDSFGVFISDDLFKTEKSLSISRISRVGEEKLQYEMLAETNGGVVPVRPDVSDGLIPVGTWFEVEMKLLEKVNATSPNFHERGTAYLNGEPASILGRMGKHVAAVLIRESGF